MEVVLYFLVAPTLTGPRLSPPAAVSPLASADSCPVPAPVSAAWTYEALHLFSSDWNQSVLRTRHPREEIAIVVRLVHGALLGFVNGNVRITVLEGVLRLASWRQSYIFP